MQESVARVFKDGKVTIPKRLKELFRIEDGCCVPLALIEVFEKGSERAHER
jgi:bifunctional DNA-binding transcriptional regulator/antitoxin component of YhaV-PrlF toxin-antitoxin module